MKVTYSEPYKELMADLEPGYRLPEYNARLIQLPSALSK